MLKFIRNWIKAAFTVLACLVAIIFAILHLLVNINGKTLLTSRLEEYFGREVKISDLYTAFPTDIYIHDVNIEGIAQIEQIKIAGGIFNVFRKSFHFSTIALEKPIFLAERKYVPVEEDKLVYSRTERKFRRIR